MKPIADLSLYTLPLDDPAFAADPDPYYARARLRHGWLADSPFGYVVHEYFAMKELLSMDDRLRTSHDHMTAHMGARGTPWGRFMETMMLAHSGAEHARLRGCVEQAFRPGRVALHRARMREVVSALLDEWAPAGAFDFAEFAAHFPITVMFGLIGAPVAALAPIRASLETQGLSFSMDRTLLPALEKAYDVLWSFTDGLMAARRASGEQPGDLLDELIRVNDERKLSDVEVRELMIFLFAAGYDTSKNMLTWIVYLLLDHPEMWARCATDRNYCTLAVEEALRHSSVSGPYRATREAMVYRDVLLPAGTVLMFPLNISGRDEKAFADAMAFDPERRFTNPPLAFGRGIHMCLGQHLARLQLQEGLHLIARRLRAIRPDGAPTWRPYPGVWGPRSLPIAFDPGPAGGH